nr:DUF935 family protein [uncultured Comamonas sp.]
MIKTIKNKLAQALQSVGLQSVARTAIGNTVNYQSVNTLDPSRLAAAFNAADQGHVMEQATLFELVEEQDPHIFAELGKRRRAVTGLGWQLQPPEDANQADLNKTAELADMLRGIPKFEDSQYDVTDAIGKGFAALEIDWKTGSEWTPKGLLWVPQRAFQFDRDTACINLLKHGVPEPLRPGGWVVHEHRARSGYIEQAALFRVLAWTYAYKAYNVRDMQRFLEVYGLPLRLGKYPSGISDQQRNELLKAVRNIGHDGAGVIADNMKIDFVQATKTGTVSDFLSAVEYWERKQSLAILGGTLTSQADGKTSTNALGQIHDRVRREIMLHDVRQIEPTWNQGLVRPIALINGMFAEDRIPNFSYLTEETVDQAKMAKVLSDAVAVGMEIDVDWAHRAMQIPRAGKDAKVLKLDKSAATPAEAALARVAALAKAGGPDDATAAYAGQLAILCAPHEEGLIQQIAAVVAEAGSFDMALEGIAALRADPKWTQDLAQGMAAAHLAGRADVGGADRG